ncbi:RNA-binding protein lark-like isoform X2 [Apostichopus japonicus]|uniref:RNA-binding protein lark-like isoform X2 n=1 Tax=Stichopus japonicus TaxID=307972 RepID=UPI003AB4E417
MTKKLFIGNLPSGCTGMELEALLKKFGEVAECDVIANKNFGFVHMGSETEAQEAVTQLDSTSFMGNLIKVQFSTTDVHKMPGVGSKGECFKCGSKGHLSRDCDRSGGRGRPGRGRGRGRDNGGGSEGWRNRDEFRDDRERQGPLRSSYRDDFRDDPYFRDREERSASYYRRPLSREVDYERRYLDEPYSRRMPLSAREYDLLYPRRSRSPIRDYEPEIRRSMYSADRDYLDRLYSSSRRDPYYDIPMRSRYSGASRAGPSRY